MSAKAVRSHRGLTTIGSGTGCECLANTLSEGEFVRGLEGRSADAADDCGAVSADERVEDDAGAGGAPELRCVWLGLVGGEWVDFGVHL